MRERAGSTAAAVALTVLAVAVVVVPLVELGRVVPAGGSAALTRVLHSPGFGSAAAHSGELAVLVPAVAVPVGTGLALVLRRPDVPCRGLLRLLIVLPLLVPQFVLGYSWSQAYGRGGFSQQLLGAHWAGLNGAVGVVVVLVVDAVPLCFLISSAALAVRAQPQLEQAARVSGAGWWACTRTVTLPMLRPVLAAEVVITAVAALESFAVPQVLGTPAGYQTMTTRVYADLALGSDPALFTDAVVLSLALVVLVALVVLPSDVLLAPRLRTAPAPSPAGPAGPSRRGPPGMLVACVIGAYCVVVALVPTAAIVLAAVTRAVGRAPTPSNWTLDNFRAALDAPTRAAIGHSLELAALAALILTVLGVSAAALGRRGWGRLLGTVVIAPFAIPGSALAVGLLIAYDRRIGGTLALILLAYLAKFWALAHRTLSGAVDRVPPDESRAAHTSGAGPLATARTIWLPALTPALVGAGLLVFVSALHEVTMSSLLYSTGNETLAVAVLNSQELGEVPTTAALSVVLTAMLLVAAVPAWLAMVLARRRRAASQPVWSAVEVADAR
ncbi:MAG TPA: ABC transporter permease subunit [Jatrophihabitans sp.]|nr:ABC transporter permease subunit [Jatrophihabitans sp.]